MVHDGGQCCRGPLYASATRGEAGHRLLPSLFLCPVPRRHPDSDNHCGRAYEAGGIYESGEIYE
ncbi:hypothetical protein FEAC_08050 [Ferrimicrobium acidiphilum DSM 19497]|uniref:Uncharacterized protein n=1 Tax=Ferrimicrobium acidiphilum DSM 19497 TaxID=1121877 RepID=A0A0D8FW95_9ACTN|nr:hypothetical protein FEAC_08050 [Ferrimicrobium acidiphilum DSM 19497]